MSAQAEILTYDVTGYIDEVIDEEGEFPTINVGDDFEGFFRFDTSTIGEPVGGPSEMEYFHESALLGVSFTVEGMTFQADPPGLLAVLVSDALEGSGGTDEVILGQETAESSEEWVDLGIYFFGSAYALSSANLPTSLQLWDWQMAICYVFMDTFEMGGIIGSLTGPTAILLGDFDTDGAVDGDDLPMWQAGFGVDDRGDADFDGDTDGNDFLIWQTHLGTFGGGAAASRAVPEPSGIVLLLTVLAGCLSRRCRPTIQHRALRCEPLEDRRMLSVGAGGEDALQVFSTSTAGRCHPL